jgi:uncharacterized protein YndB with AHSA1/START domain
VLADNSCDSLTADTAGRALAPDTATGEVTGGVAGSVPARRETMIDAASGPSAAETTLRLTRRFTAPRERVFRAWTEPEALKRWWIPKQGFSVPEVAIDLRAGGGYRVTMQNPAGERFALTGTYREVRPPERLVYTWRWEGTREGGRETLVTVEFRDLGAATEVTVVHELFPDAAACARHRDGWSGCLDRLPGALA